MPWAWDWQPPGWPGRSASGKARLRFVLAVAIALLYVVLVLPHLGVRASTA
jgi:hypothetical protein